MASLLFALLHLLALILVVRILLPPVLLLTNPYATAAGLLLNRLLRAVRPALPLPDRALCVVLLTLDFAACAALLTRLGGPVLPLGGFAIATYPARGFLGWFGLELLHFGGFMLALLAGNTLLRLWHLGRTLPGYTGDLIDLACRPFSGLRIPAQIVLIALLSLGYTAIALACASDVAYPSAEIMRQLVKDLPAAANLPPIFDLAAVAAPLRTLILAALAILNILGTLGYHIFVLLLLTLLAAILNARPMLGFLNDALRLLTGPIPPLRLGPIDFAPMVALFTLGFLETALSTLLLLLAQGLAHVV